MGRLTAIELYNFKSYKGIQTIDLGDAHFTSIIGPNGAGKSNMMDAISFVLGIRSNHLRTVHLNDLVYRGKMSEEDPAESAGRAHVMVKYEKTGGRVLELKRSISNGTSEYRINGKVVTASQYSDNLSKENILIKAKNFLVFQGDVESIASQSPKDLTRLIEQISGSLEFKDEYERLKKIQEETAENSAASFNRKRGYNAEIKHYEVQQQQAQEFNDKVQERDSVFIQHALWKLFHLEKNIGACEKELDKSTKIISDAKQDLEQQEEALDDVNLAYATANKSLAKIEKQAATRTRDLEEKQNNLLPVMEKITSLENSIKKRTARKEILLTEMKKQQREVEKFDRDLRIVNKALEKFEQEANEEETSLSGLGTLSPEDYVDYQQLRLQFSERTSAEQDVMDGLVRQKNVLEEKIESLESKIDQAKADEERQQTDIDRIKFKVDRISASINRDNEELKEKKKQLNDITAQKQQHAKREVELNAKLQQTVKSLLEYNASKKDFQRTRKLFEEVEALKRLFPGVHGLVYELCKPKEKKFETAVATVLGKDFNSIVVDNFAVAQNCISYLKEQRLGVASFIPLDSVVVRPINGALRDMNSRSRLAVDVVEYHTNDERAIQYVCGDTLICDNLDVAKEIKWQKKIAVKCVTTDGAVIHKANLMSGGKADDSNTKKWSESKLHSLTILKDELISQLQELSRNSHTHANREERLVSEVQSIETKLDTSRTTLRSLQIMFQSREDEKVHVLGTQEKIKPLLRSAQKELGQICEKIDNLDESMSGIREDVFRGFCERVGISDISRYEQITSRYQEKTMKKRLQYTSQIKRLEYQKAFETQRLQELESRVKTLSDNIAGYHESLSELEAEKNKLQSVVEGIQRDLEGVEEEIKGSKLQVEQKYTLAQSRREKVIEDQRKVARLIKQKAEQREKLERARAQKMSTLRDCKVDGVNVPFSRGSFDDVPLGEVPETATENQEKTDIGNEGDIDVEIDYSDLAKDLKRTNDSATEESLMEKVRVISSELDNMVVNTRAGERLNNVTARFQQVEKEFATRRQEARDAKEKFNDIKKQRSEMFQQAFDHVAKVIDEIYKDLTKTEAFPMGGSAYLSLDNEDEPFLDGVNYHAMPPMKRFCDMELLSGGEKTIAALALLFAINSYQPSPFFILDEIDAALDNVNVDSVGRWIQKTAHDGLQFIVISLKTTLFENSDALVGIYRDQDINSSRALNLDLRAVAH